MHIRFLLFFSSCVAWTLYDSWQNVKNFIGPLPAV